MSFHELISNKVTWKKNNKKKTKLLQIELNCMKCAIYWVIAN